MSISKLLACPFCNEAELLACQMLTPSNPDWHVMCNNCGSCTHEYETQDEAIAAWNRRADRESTEDASPYARDGVTVERLCEALGISWDEYQEAYTVSYKVWWSKEKLERAAAALNARLAGDGEKEE
jgi:hypothetical protein